jgi:CDP-diacylglycerol---glycerol-3-phosphate 3-phosphatidyltransferase
LLLFVYFFTLANVAACLLLVGFVALTDLLDGYLARKLDVSSKFGPYVDALADFIFLFGVFAYFTIYGYYPFWLPLLIAASFIQFILTSVYTKKIYDPVGRYIGSALYIGIVLTVVYPILPVLLFVQFGFLAFFLISLASRLISLKRKH